MQDDSGMSDYPLLASCRCQANGYINLLVSPRQEIFASQYKFDILLEKKLSGVAGQGNVIWEIQDEITRWFL